jgi:hypothetical protein
MHSRLATTALGACSKTLEYGLHEPFPCDHEGVHLPQVGLPLSAKLQAVNCIGLADNCSGCGVVANSASVIRYCLPYSRLPRGGVHNYGLSLPPNSQRAALWSCPQGVASTSLLSTPQDFATSLEWMGWHSYFPSCAPLHRFRKKCYKELCML